MTALARALYSSSVVEERPRGWRIPWFTVSARAADVRPTRGAESLANRQPGCSCGSKRVLREPDLVLLRPHSHFVASYSLRADVAHPLRSQHVRQLLGRAGLVVVKIAHLTGPW